MTPIRPSAAYVDTSALAAIAFDEQTAPSVATRLAGFSSLMSSNLLEAELRAAYTREAREFNHTLLFRIGWIFPDRPLSDEIAAALRVGYLRGADLWHIATALYAARTLPRLAFVTLDVRQLRVADGLGFAT